MPTYFPPSGRFELVTPFVGASSILTSMPVIEGLKGKGHQALNLLMMKAQVAILEESKVLSTGVEIVPTDVSATTVMVARMKAAQHQKEELELDLAELTKK
ncbi:uncharacterized protein A4U43_C02F11680 [Asparagus officinalis]|uniref:Uncharacterized protein n=1 Tax=Asparagus officinalis TaxID=4686 RepID=A0A5P1FMG6_ASPOF|nr:uncharacterized protein A4U43_C02F11680 [Asparagus officinalis]